MAEMGRAAHVEIPVYDSNDRPTEFKDGLMTYVRATLDYGQSKKYAELEQFLLCTSCTISYMFGKLDDFMGIKATEMMSFKHGADSIPVNFVNVDLQLYENDDAETPHSFNMDIGLIDPMYQTPMYFDHF